MTKLSRGEVRLEAELELEQPTPAEVAQDAAVGETLAPPEVERARRERAAGLLPPLLTQLDDEFVRDRRDRATAQDAAAGAAVMHYDACGRPMHPATECAGRGCWTDHEMVEIGGVKWRTCSGCGGLVLPGATCPTDGRVAPQA